MFDADTFVAECVNAVRDAQPRLAVRDLLAEAVRDPAAVAAAFASHASRDRPGACDA